MTSFAGSIGIIGIALILAVSNGLTGYINKMQSDALGNYPITVTAISVDMDKFSSLEVSDDNEEKVNDDVVVPYNPMQQFIKYGHYNNLTTQFVNHIKAFEEEDKKKGENSQLNAVDYNYYTPLKIVSSYSENAYNLYTNTNNTSILTGSTSNTFYQLLNNMDFIMQHYDLIYGELPQNAEGKNYSTELLLVVGKGNKLSIQTLNALGIAPTINSSGNYDNIDFKDICEKQYKLLYNDDYYTPNSNNFDEITQFAKLAPDNQEALKTAYDNAQITLKISGVLRIKDDAPSDILSSGIAYMPSLGQHYLDNCKNSLIAQKQIANKSSYCFYDNYVVTVSEMSSVLPKNGFSNVSEINAFLNLSYGYTLSKDEAFELAMQQIGISSIPVGIALYPKNFDGKDAIINTIKEYNKTVTNKNLEIVYSDSTEFLTSTLGQMVNIVSYVLIAFSAISLVVSSIMIGIITYVSVIERTKEIGVLRSIGARKKDISRVFNAETILIGISAGLIGVLISFILTFPISAIIKIVANGAVTTQLAVLDPVSAVCLIVISTLLTLVSGLVPAKVAAKKDPVKALRTE